MTINRIIGIKPEIIPYLPQTDYDFSCQLKKVFVGKNVKVSFVSEDGLVHDTVSGNLKSAVVKAQNLGYIKYNLVILNIDGDIYFFKDGEITTTVVSDKIEGVLESIKVLKDTDDKIKPDGNI